MSTEDVIAAFLGLEDDDRLKEALKLLIETQRAYRDVEAQRISRREADNVRRTYLKYMRKHGLKTVDEEEGLAENEFAIVRDAAETDESALQPLNQDDLWLLTDFEAICALWLAEDVKVAEGFPDALREFLSDPDIESRLKERLFERDKERGAYLLTAILEEEPSDLAAHSLLVGLYEKEERWAEIEAEYKRFLDETDDEMVWANYGDFLERRGRYSEAFTAFKESLEVCERIGTTGEGLGEVIKERISRVERMMHLEGEEARKAREYWESVWLLEEVRAFADRRLRKEMEKAQDEYKEAAGLEKLRIDLLFEFLNWFLFSRKLADGRTPGLMYADEKGLGEELRAKIEKLGNPITGAFEVARADPASFTLVVEEVGTGKEYELRGEVPELEEGLNFAMTIYPWGDIYFTGGVLRALKEAS
jgi:tetratricopeptide (TPR) repeat protein